MIPSSVYFASAVSFPFPSSEGLFSTTNDIITTAESPSTPFSADETEGLSGDSSAPRAELVDDDEIASASLKGDLQSSESGGGSPSPGVDAAGTGGGGALRSPFGDLATGEMLGDVL